MREQRIEDTVIYIKFPRKSGNKKVETAKLGLYLASQFQSSGKINITGKTYPPAPLRKDLKDEYWARKHYRIMINERWLMPKAQYQFYTLEEVLGMVKEAIQ